MTTLRKWLQPVIIAILVVWLIWLTLMQYHLYAWTQPLPESSLLKEMVALQTQIIGMQDEINELKGVK